jgi:hypothetical protein
LNPDPMRIRIRNTAGNHQNTTFIEISLYQWQNNYLKWAVPQGSRVQDRIFITQIFKGRGEIGDQDRSLMKSCGHPVRPVRTHESPLSKKQCQIKLLHFFLHFFIQFLSKKPWYGSGSWTGLSKRPRSGSGMSKSGSATLLKSNKKLIINHNFTQYFFKGTYQWDRFFYFFK